MFVWYDMVVTALSFDIVYLNADLPPFLADHKTFPGRGRLRKRGIARRITPKV